MRNLIPTFAALIATASPAAATDSLSSKLLGAASTSVSELDSSSIRHAEFPGSRPLLLEGLSRRAITEQILEDEGPQLVARLLVSTGPQARIGVLFDLAPGWHLYWQNPGGTGLAPKIRFAPTEPSNAPHLTFGEIDWPAPETFAEADGLFTTWGYEGSVLLSAPISRGASDTQIPGSTVTARARVLVCRTQCVPAEFELTSSLEPNLARHEQARVDERFAQSEARWPSSADALGLEVRATWLSTKAEAGKMEDDRGRLIVDVSSCAKSGDDSCAAVATPPDSSLFIPIEGDIFELEGTQVIKNDPTRGQLSLGVDVIRLDEGDGRLRGLLPVSAENGVIRHVSIDIPIADPSALAASPGAMAGPTPAERGASSVTPGSNDPLGAKPTERHTSTSWASVLLFALLGGFILNGMPCVLPVLAIKIFSIAEMAERDAREVRNNGLAYTGGILASMSLLSVVVITLRAAGHSVGWGFQFQEPLFVAVICAVLVTFALNLFGLFEIELGQGRLATVGQNASGVRRAAFEGLLAVVLATPCTAPFLGTAVGFAFASSGFSIAAVFLAIGLGLAAPFLMISFQPSLARFVPKSGPWMNTLRSGLGFCLLATVVWLLWVLGKSGGADIVVAMTGVLLFLSFLLWIFGQLQPVRHVWLGRASAALIAGIAFAGFNLIGLDRVASLEPGGEPSLEVDDEWRPYSEASVVAALEAGHPAFVVFTADWCITCQVNERTVLRRDAIKQRFSASEFALFKADWTHRDEAIRGRLADFGRAGVPLYLVYHPSRPDEPEVLSELLSQSEVLSALDAASPGTYGRVETGRL